MQYTINGKGERTLRLEAKWDPSEVKAYLDEHDILNLSFFEDYDSKTSLEAVLSPYHFVKGLLISSQRAHDWGFLQSFAALEHLTILALSHPSIDLSECQQLRYAHVPWHARLGLEAMPKLESLYLVGYTPSNLMPLSKLTNLHFLGFYEPKLRSLYGISSLTRLETFNLYKARNLKWVAALNGLPRLSRLEINGSPKVKDYARWTDLPALERLKLDYCGDISSITFLRRLKALKFIRLGGNTRVVDKNIGPLEEILSAFYERRDQGKWGPRT